MLFQMRREQGEPAAQAAAGVLCDNIYGLELDARCVKLPPSPWRWQPGSRFSTGRKPAHPHIACSGLPLGADPDECAPWRTVTVPAEALLNYGLPRHELGSLIDPLNNGFDSLPIFKDKQDELLTTGKGPGQRKTRGRPSSSSVR